MTGTPDSNLSENIQYIDTQERQQARIIAPR